MYLMDIDNFSYFLLSVELTILKSRESCSDKNFIFSQPTHN